MNTYLRFGFVKKKKHVLQVWNISKGDKSQNNPQSGRSARNKK